jgi:hypothetical protein
MSPRRRLDIGRDSGDLVDRLERLAGDHEGVSRFLRGLAIGALVGAAVAGSTFWERRRERTKSADARTGTDDA